MSAQVFETILARLYTEDEFRKIFLESPSQALLGQDLTPDELADLVSIDKAGLVMVSHSLTHKRQKSGALRKKFFGQFRLPLRKSPI